MKFNAYSKITKEEAVIISNLILKKTKESTTFQKYQEMQEIIECSKIISPDIGSIYLLDVFKNTDTILRLSGEEQLFNDITQRLEYKIEEAEKFVDTHEEQCYLLRLHEYWVEKAGRWINDPDKNFHECIEAIMRINHACKYNIFNTEDMEMLYQILTLEN